MVFPQEFYEMKFKIKGIRAYQSFALMNREFGAIGFHKMQINEIMTIYSTVIKRVK